MESVQDKLAKKPVTPPLEHFESWAEMTLFHPKSLPFYVYSAQITGAIIGILSSPVMYKLAAEFPDELYEDFNIDNPPSEKLLEFLFGVLAVIPMAALAGIATHDSFKKLVSPKEEIVDLYSKRLRISKKLAGENLLTQHNV